VAEIATISFQTTVCSPFFFLSPQANSETLLISDKIKVFREIFMAKSPLRSGPL